MAAKKVLKSASTLRSLRNANRNALPTDYIRGSITPGEKYTAYKTKSGKAPDFGKGNGPGTPYREVQKTFQQPRTLHRAQGLPTGSKPSKGPSDAARGEAVIRRAIGPSIKKAKINSFANDAKTKAIARRLNNG